MRKIERDMIAAIRAGINGRNARNVTRWNNGNTSVVSDQEAGTVRVFLHGNLIAEYTANPEQLWASHWRYTLCGWNTPTTRSRLSSIMREFEPAEVCGVGTKLGQPSIHFRNAPDKPIPSNNWFTVD